MSHLLSPIVSKLIKSKLNSIIVGTPSTTFLVDTTSAVISEDFDTLPNDGDQYTFSDGLETATTFTLPGWLSYSTASYPRVLSLDSVSTHSNYHTFPVYSWSNTTEAAASDLKLGFFPHSRGTNSKYRFLMCRWN